MRHPLERHEPSAEFAARLESQLVSEVRRRNLRAQGPAWATWSLAQVLTAAAVVVLASMSVGGAAVVVAYEAQNSQVRDQLLSNVERRAGLARMRLDQAAKEQEAAQRRFEVGLEGSAAVLEKDTAVAGAQAEVDLLALDLEEIRLTGREPRSELSAPRVSGRDFVGERLRVELSVPEKVLVVERQLLEAIEKRVAIGVVGPVDLEVARSRVFDVEASLETIRRKIAIREQFLSGKIAVAETELRVLEAEAEQKTKTLAPKIELARQEVARLTQKADVGLVLAVDVAQATVRRLELETALSKAELDLLLIRRRLSEHREP